ncbi:MAG: DMT family transporter [Bdellovibrionota bacterium]
MSTRIEDIDKEKSFMGIWAEASSNASLGVALGAATISLAPIFVKWIVAAPSVVAFYRCVFALAFLFPFCFRQLRQRMEWKQRAFWGWAWLGGFGFAMDLWVWHRSIEYVGAGMATILCNMQVFVSGLVGYLFLKEKLTLRWVLSSCLAVVGVAFLVGIFGSTSFSREYVYGIAFGLLTAPFYTIYVFALRQIQVCDHRASIKTCMGAVLIFSAMFSFFIARVSQDSFSMTQNQFFLYLGLALGPQLLGWLMISKNLTKIPLATSGLLLLIQPVFAFVLGVVLFSERFSVLQCCGAVITITSIYVAAISRRSAKS